MTALRHSATERSHGYLLVAETLFITRFYRAQVRMVVTTGLYRHHEDDVELNESLWKMDPQTEALRRRSAGKQCMGGRTKLSNVRLYA